MAQRTYPHRTRSSHPADAGDRLAAYNPDNRPWHEVPDDGYLYDHLADLLLAAGREADLLALFQDDHWMRARFAQSNCTYTGFMADLMAAWEGVAQPRAAEDPNALARCARFALIRAAITSLCIGEVRIQPAPYVSAGASQRVYAGASPEQLSGFAPRLMVAPKEAAFNRAYQAAFTPELAIGSRRRSLDRALDAAVAIDDASGRAHALALLGPCLPGDQAARALDAAFSLDNAYYRARAVEALLPHLSGAALVRALSAGPAVSSLPRIGLPLSAFWQIVVAPALRSVAPALDLPRRLLRWLSIFHLASSKEKYRDAARACRIPGPRGQAARAAHINVNDLRLLEALIPRLSRSLLARTLEEVIAHPCEGGKARSIPWFAPHADEALMSRALEGALMLEYEGDRAYALRGLAPYLSDTLRARALPAARAIDSGRLRAVALLALLPHAGGEAPALIQEIREAVGSWLLDEQSRTFDEVVLPCLDDALFCPPVLGRRALLDIHRSIGEISRRWRWQ